MIGKRKTFIGKLILTIVVNGSLKGIVFPPLLFPAIKHISYKRKSVLELFTSAIDRANAKG
jgi:hypothetical protein